jgi:hypothetical protein
MSNKKKLKELLKKEKEAERKYKFRLSRFRGVPHESAAGELSYSELKVREDYLKSVRDEIAVLQKKMENQGR